MPSPSERQTRTDPVLMNSWCLEENLWQSIQDTDYTCRPSPEAMREYAHRLWPKVRHATEMRGLIADRIDGYTRHLEATGQVVGRVAVRKVKRLRRAANYVRTLRPGQDVYKFGLELPVRGRELDIECQQEWVRFAVAEAGKRALKRKRDDDDDDA